MKRIKEKILQFGYDEDVYNIYIDEINDQNFRNVKVVSFIGGIMMTLLTIFSLFSSSVGRVFPLYLATTIMFAFIYIVALINNNKNHIVTLICNYGFLSVAFIFAVGLDIIQKNPTATTICVLLVALPLFIVDKPVREFIFFLIISLIFMYESAYIKCSPKASLDILNAVSFLVIGTFLGYKHDVMIIRNIRGNSLLEKQRDTDSLTNLYNKGALELRAIQYLNDDHNQATIIVIDMDNFKYLNDHYGHHCGDEILTKIADALMSECRKEDMISRFGGDEFTIFLPGLINKDVISDKINKIYSKINEITLEVDSTYRPHLSMGIASFPEDGKTFDEIFANADNAMYQAKKSGKNTFEFYNKDSKRKILVVDDVEMNRAILRKTLMDKYDIYEAKDGVEALDVLNNNIDIELVISDIYMPRMNGIELAKELRSNDFYKHISIICITQQNNTSAEEDLYKIGIDDFIYKASSPRVIQLRVNNVINARN